MKSVQITDEQEIQMSVSRTFSGDVKLFEQYHVINNNISEAVSDTVGKIKDLIKNNGATFYSLQDIEDKEIGYICVLIESCVLYSFGLNKKYRTESNKQEFFELLDKVFNGNPIICSLYKKNSRAIQWLMNNGFEEEPCITLIKKQK